MRKQLYTLALLLTASIIFTSCRNDDDPDPSVITDEGVVINGVRWATRNVAAPGTFASTPESAGMLFQWNRRRGWNNTDITEPRDWDTTPATGAVWERTNDPCPTGWRVPTREEMESLYNAGHQWTVQNGVSGRFFGTYPYRIFLPAAGFRSALGMLGMGIWGFYWNGTQYSGVDARLLQFNSQTASAYKSNRASGSSIRCVFGD